MTYRPRLMQLAHSTTLKWSPASHMKTDGYYDARSESSHHCPKSRQGAIANDVEMECIGTPHTTVSQHAERVTTRHSHCKDVEIWRIGTSHMTKLQLQSRITNESQYQFRDRSYTVTKPRGQSTINMMEKSSKEQRNFKRGR
jgi:hypothetical protein